jgi:hypothetical protein
MLSNKAHSFQPIQKILLEKKIDRIPIMDMAATLLQMVCPIMASIL